MEAFGCSFKDIELKALFDKFDSDQSGKLDYVEFSNFFARMGSGNNPNVNPVFGMQREPPNQILDKIRKMLVSRGAHGIRGLGILFRRMDQNGDKSMDRLEFQWGLRENGHKLSAADFERVFKYFDKNASGKIDYNEFLRAVKGPLNPMRKALVAQVYHKLDKTGDGKVTIDDIKDSYNVEYHPKFKTGEMNKKEILLEFLSQWDTVKKDGIVTLEEFCEYYADVSSSIDRDDYFELMIRNAWHLPGGEGVCANTSIPRHLVTDADGNQHVEMAKGSANFDYKQNSNNFYGGEA